MILPRGYLKTEGRRCKLDLREAKIRGSGMKKAKKLVTACKHGIEVRRCWK